MSERHRDIAGDEALYYAGLLPPDELFDPLYVDSQPPHDVVPSYEELWAKQHERLQVGNMSPEKQSELCVLIQAGTVARKIAAKNIERRQALQVTIDAGEQAAEQLLEQNFRYIAWFARETLGWHTRSNAAKGKEPRRSKFNDGMLLSDYAGAPLDYGERIQAAAIGFLQAANKHSPEEGRLINLAVWYMERSLVTEMRNETYYTTRLPDYQHDRITELLALVQKIENRGERINLQRASQDSRQATTTLVNTAAIHYKYGRRLTLEEVAERLREHEADRRAADDGDDSQTWDEQTEVDIYDRRSSEPFLEVETASQLEELVWSALERLPDERLQELIILRFGLESGQPMSLKDVGATLEKPISTVRVGQLEKRALSINARLFKEGSRQL
jgi:RNA polymerase sigma factor (sigma-70 family)